jgi:hypothetical protein
MTQMVDPISLEKAIAEMKRYVEAHKEHPGEVGVGARAMAVLMEPYVRFEADEINRSTPPGELGSGLVIALANIAGSYCRAVGGEDALHVGHLFLKSLCHNTVMRLTTEAAEGEETSFKVLEGGRG